jgi:hypothetical protein
VQSCKSGLFGPRKFMKVGQASSVLDSASSFVAPVVRAVSQQLSAAEQIPPGYSRAEENARSFTPVRNDTGLVDPEIPCKQLVVALDRVKDLPLFQFCLPSPFTPKNIRGAHNVGYNSDLFRNLRMTPC